LIFFFVIGYLYDVESEKQKYLEYESFEEVIEQLLTDLLKRMEFKRVREDLDEKTHQRIMENQKSYFLHEQMRLIQEELDQEGEEADPEFAKIEEAILEAKMPQEVLEKAMEISNVIYTIHSAGSEKFVARACKAGGFEITHLWRYSIPLRRSYAFHEKEFKYIAVEVYRLRRCE